MLSLYVKQVFNRDRFISNSCHYYYDWIFFYNPLLRCHKTKSVNWLLIYSFGSPCNLQQMFALCILKKMFTSALDFRERRYESMSFTSICDEYWTDRTLTCSVGVMPFTYSIKLDGKMAKISRSYSCSEVFLARKKGFSLNWGGTVSHRTFKCQKLLH